MPDYYPRIAKEALETVEYQIRKTFRATTDQEKIIMTQGIYDSNIDSDTGVTVDNNFPEVGCGTTIAWTPENTGATIERRIFMVTDNFIDAQNFVPAPIVNPNLPQMFGVNGEFLELSNEDFLVITSSLIP